ncbi:hypothetical protein M8J76_010721 [Diaphorina citri]|nr:hypothetical protein M8J76_010721 [Diaphorina citri]KAI5734501.1 hypothetical protein M8J77_007199 [Diaphorina citri]
MGITLCHQPSCAEKETLSRLLGSCHKNELFRNTRHHTIQSSIANELCHLRWTVDRETSCISEDSSTRQCDIVAVNTEKFQVIILNPTVRFEKSALQALEVNTKRSQSMSLTYQHT